MAVFDSVRNYYEQLVFNAITKYLSESESEVDEDDEDFTEDVACIALNKLPAHYIRHVVDTGFYMTANEHADIEIAVEKAVNEAVKQVTKHSNGPYREGEN
ncbi:MAG: late competence development ComFB family protein [Methylococcales bacterium]|jgi:competence protein ComFB|nr:late competence development ComFB family protein [Methylococcales bacterium]MBT7411005.1 late competence development ComFB family protein [Methylococcales bacterium]